MCIKYYFYYNYNFPNCCSDILITSISHHMTYPDFCAEITDICKFDAGQPFTIKWVDEDGDPCIISSQIELNEAIRLYELNKDSEINMHGKISLFMAETCKVLRFVFLNSCSTVVLLNFVAIIFC